VRIALATHRALPQLSQDDRLAAQELRAQGAVVESAVWDSPLIDWSQYDAVILRSTWDYHLRRDEFVKWLAHLDAVSAVVFNPTSLIRWNIDKHYLGDLAARGVPVAETMFLERGHSTLPDLFARLPWTDVVIKPTVSASGYETRRTSAQMASANAQWFSELHARNDLMIQPFFDEVVENGEWSLVFFAGQYSHAVRKVAAPGEFKVQREHGGALIVEQPRGLLVERAEAVTRLLPDGWLYARVDGFERDGSLVITEVELIEPSLFLGQHPSAPRRFATAIRHAAAGRRTPLQFTPRSVTPPPGTLGL
jgi:glutathione synthase/RimK-type ligase-like ATP-grasp enzyme